MSQAVLQVVGTLLLTAVFLPSLIHHVTNADTLVPVTESALSSALGQSVSREVAAGVYWASSALLLGAPLLVLGLVLPVLRKFGALMLALFLVGVTPVMHAFWGQADSVQQQAQLAHFLKNVSLLGALLLVLAEPPRHTTPTQAFAQKNKKRR